MDKIARRNLLLAGVVAAPAIAALTKSAQADTIFTGFSYPISGGYASLVGRNTPDRFADALNVKEFGAVGDDVHDDTAAIQACFDAAFGPASNPHGALNYALNKAVCFPNGQYKITSAIVLNQVFGGHIYGLGARGSVAITLTGTGSSSDTVVQCDGLEFSNFDNISFGIASNQTVGTVFAMDRALNTTNVNIQSNTFTNCDFGSGAVGVWINKTNQPTSQGSENSFINCFWTGPPGNTAFSGLRIKGQNAVMNCVWGGDFQAHTIGIDIPLAGGSCYIIHGVSFQSTGAAGTLDIQVLTSSPDDYSVTGCRSESPNFAWFQGGSAVNISSCAQTSGVGGAFLFADGAVTVSSCHIGGQFYGNMQLTLDNCFFQSATPWTGSAGTFGGIINGWRGPPPGAQFNTTFTQARWTVANLPPASMCLGMRLYVIDSSVSVTNNTNLGAIVAASATIASFNGTISDGAGSPGTILSVSSGTGIAAGQVLRGANITSGALIQSGSALTWATNFAMFISPSEAMTTAAQNIVPVWSDGTNWRIG